MPGLSAPGPFTDKSILLQPFRHLQSMQDGTFDQVGPHGLELILHPPHVGDATPDLGDLVIDEFRALNAIEGGRLSRCQDRADLRQGEPDVLSRTDEGEFIDYAGTIGTIVVDIPSRGVDQPFGFIEADRMPATTTELLYFADAHESILDYRPNSIV